MDIFLWLFIAVTTLLLAMATAITIAAVSFHRYRAAFLRESSHDAVDRVSNATCPAIAVPGSKDSTAGWNQLSY